MHWHDRPLGIEYLPKDIDYIMFIDENGTNDMNYIEKKCFAFEDLKKEEIYFTITGCIIRKDDLNRIATKLNNIKYVYWEDGCCYYKRKKKRICFHSREIRKKEGPFYMDADDYKYFMIDLSSTLKEIPVEIISININKKELWEKYYNPEDPYDLSAKFLIERYTRFLSKKNSKGIMLLEARGKKEDKKVLESLKNNIKYGTGDNQRCYVSSDKFNSRIKGVYFNPKWSKKYDSLKSYYGLEIADLYSYPIHQFVRNGCENKNRAFKSIENKLINHPNYYGYGLKIFP